MIDDEHAAAILTTAYRDLRSLIGMLQTPDQFDDEIFGFHAQQAVEKALKAWIALRSVRYPLTHNLKVLVDVLESIGEDTAWLPDLTSLSRYAVQLRYASLAAGEKLDRVAVFDQAQAIYRRAEKLIDPLTRGGS